MSLTLETATPEQERLLAALPVEPTWEDRQEARKLPLDTRFTLGSRITGVQQAFLDEHGFLVFAQVATAAELEAMEAGIRDLERRWLAEQRKTVYTVRQEVLEGQDLRDKIETMFGGVLPRMGATFEGDPEGYAGWFHRAFGIECPDDVAKAATLPRENDPQPATELVSGRLAARWDELGDELMQRIASFLLLRTIDQKWMDHLRGMDALRAGIGLRGYAQKDPKNEYKQEGFELFNKMLAAIEDDVTSLILRVEVRRPDEAEPGQPQAAGAQAPPPLGAGATPLAQAAQQGRELSQADQERIAREKAMRQAQMRAAAQRTPAALAFDRQRRMEQLRAAQAQARSQAGAQTAGGAPPSGGQAPGASGATGAPGTSAPDGVGRNDPCPCGSGKKYKKCHGQGS